MITTNSVRTYLSYHPHFGRMIWMPLWAVTLKIVLLFLCRMPQISYTIFCLSSLCQFGWIYFIRSFMLGFDHIHVCTLSSATHSLALRPYLYPNTRIIFVVWVSAMMFEHNCVWSLWPPPGICFRNWFTLICPKFESILYPLNLIFSNSLKSMGRLNIMMPLFYFWGPSSST